MMLIGIMFSSGYSNVISLNNSGLLLTREASDEFNQENVLLWLNEPRQMQEYELVYKGQYIESADFPDYIERTLVRPTPDPAVVVARQPLQAKNRTYFEKGDSIRIHPENTYFRVDYYKDEDFQFTLYPRGQVNPSMGLIASPDIKRFAMRDLYTHISSMPDPKEEIEWSEPESQTVRVGQRFFINDYVAVLEGIERINEVEDVPLLGNDIAVKAKVRVFGKADDYLVEPIYIIRMDDRAVGIVPADLYELGLRLTLNKINPEDETFELVSSFTQKDYVILKAMEKPLINILWIGTILLTVGFTMAMGRRYSEFRKMRDKGLE